MNKYPVLKFKQVDLATNIDLDFVELVFANAHIIVGIICPEASEASVRDLNNKNLKPYEHVCAKYSGSDYQYSLVNFNAAGRRVLQGFKKVYQPLTVPTLTIIVSYLEYQNEN